MTEGCPKPLPLIKHTMKNIQIQERTFIIIKPDGVQRSLVGEIIGRFERTGLKFTAMKMFVPTEKQALAHYAKDDAWCEQIGARLMKKKAELGESPEKTAVEYGRDVLSQLVRYMRCSPVVAMVAQGNQAVGVVRKIVGGTEPLTSDVGTIRGDLTIDSYDCANADGRSVRNLVHCSESPAEAEREIAIWFSKEELLAYKHINEGMLYDVNFDGNEE